MARDETPKKRRFNSLLHVKQFLAETINALNADEITEGKAHQLGYLCKIMADFMQASDLEERVTKLEEQRGL